MGNWHRYAVATAVYMPLIVIILVVGRSECSRDLRPSEHGLSYQSNATVAAAAGDDSPETMSFFGGTTSAATASVPFPEEKNGTSDASWGRGVSGGGGQRRDHGKDALVVASVVCGATGVVLLVVASLLFVFQYQRQRSNNERTKC
ncbi:hypothetical protein Vadar_005976 [Vaccinium darrowii]|uniref:Uncharacterized protein n=1 Tax=Vaccinium darrowii TaxID=229202 RepID=A0ACB7X7V3_9ERIC|nr:hypothetical protein Vadar_005976 [Vaccinium darrowii]